MKTVPRQTLMLEITESAIVHYLKAKLVLNIGRKYLELGMHFSTLEDIGQSEDFERYCMAQILEWNDKPQKAMEALQESICLHVTEELPALPLYQYKQLCRIACKILGRKQSDIVDGVSVGSIGE